MEAPAARQGDSAQQSAGSEAAGQRQRRHRRQRCFLAHPTDALSFVTRRGQPAHRPAGQPAAGAPSFRGSLTPSSSPASSTYTACGSVAAGGGSTARRREAPSAAEQVPPAASTRGRSPLPLQHAPPTCVMAPQLVLTTLWPRASNSCSRWAGVGPVQQAADGSGSAPASHRIPRSSAARRLPAHPTLPMPAPYLKATPPAAQSSSMLQPGRAGGHGRAAWRQEEHKHTRAHSSAAAAAHAPPPPTHSVSGASWWCRRGAATASNSPSP